jgi:hypothetical protein
MKQLLIQLLFCTSLATSSIAQKTEKVFLDKNDTTANSYIIIYPTTNHWKGFMFVMPGFGESPEFVLMQTDFPKHAAASGILTIIPTFKTGVTSIGFDDATQQSFQKIFEDVYNKYKLVDLPLFVGGFSIGGTCAIKFAENASIKPNAVFAIDPPLDFERFYNTCIRNIRLSKTTAPNPEAVYMVDRLEKEMQGTPTTNLQNYYKYSPFSYSDTNQTEIKKLVSIPIRIYSEPDINWWIKERGADLSSMNIFDISCFINELKRLGNTKATLVATQNKGFRKPDNRRHPHSWSIMNKTEIVKWLLSQK